MLRRFKAAGGKARGVLWYQGESDANDKAAPLFAKKFETLVMSIREDFGQPDLPFYYVQIGRHISASNISEWNVIQESQRKAEPLIPRAVMVASVDLEMDDGIHIGTRDFRRLAARLANLACHDLFPADKKCADLKRGPRPVSARVEGSSIRVLFAEVNGKLRSSGGRISGFTIHGADGNAVPHIYKARVDPQEANAVLLDFGGKLPEGAVLRYGAGKDPYCNLTDEADMAAPVFGPMSIETN
jgi:sialate O-acetylesterase